MTTVVDVCNDALTHLGAAHITALDQGTRNANLCNTNYAVARDVLLARYDWSFAIARTQLLGVEYAYPPPTYSYGLPSDLLKIIPPISIETDWIIEGKNLLTNTSSPIQVRYIKQITVPDDMHVLFRATWACHLAVRMCEAITQSNTKIQILQSYADEILREAKRIHAIQKLSSPFPEDEWTYNR